MRRDQLHVSCSKGKVVAMASEESFAMQDNPEVTPILVYKIIPTTMAILVNQ